MIRAKGGRRQPRYFQLKDKASERLCSLLEYRTAKPDVEFLINSMEQMAEHTSISIWMVWNKQ